MVYDMISNLIDRLIDMYMQYEIEKQINYQNIIVMFCQNMLQNVE